jgi:polyhydroxyalkanoate synthesis regulator phasin
MAGKKSTKQPVNGQKKTVDATLQLNFNDVMKFFGNLFRSGMEFRQTVNDMIDQKMDQMVSDGKYTKAEAKAAGNKLKKGMDEATGKFTGRLSDGIRSTLNRINIATLDDIKSLEIRLDTMLKTLEDLNTTEKVTKKPTSSRTTAKKPSSSASKKTSGTTRSKKADVSNKSGRKSKSGKKAGSSTTS